jgi:hypothetical protein
MIKTCKICGCNLTTERKYCKECRKQLKREYVRNRYKKMLENGEKRKRYGVSICIYCGEEFIKNRPEQTAHGKCSNLHRHKTVENYNTVKRTKDGKATLGRQLLLDLNLNLNNMVVHHIDENPNNNVLSNLMILNKSHHAKLHRILEKNWSLLSKDNNSNLENCWNILRDQLTTTYLETNSVNVIKITDIGQSAAEPLNTNNIYIFNVQEEGSETMYQAPKSITQGEDIVQTQTIEK